MGAHISCCWDICVLWGARTESCAITLAISDTSGLSAALEYSSKILPEKLVLVVVRTGSGGLAASSKELVRSSVVTFDGRSDALPAGGGVSGGRGM